MSNLLPHPRLPSGAQFIVDKEQALRASLNHPPLFRFKYDLKFPFDQVCRGYLNKFTWEYSGQLTSFSNEKQIDEDTVQFTRKQDSIFNTDVLYEQVTINRKVNTIHSELFICLKDGTKVPLKKELLKGDSEAQTKIEQEVFQTPSREMVVEQFKRGVSDTVKGMHFLKFFEESSS